MADSFIRADEQGRRTLTEMMQWWRRIGGPPQIDPPRGDRTKSSPVPYHRGVAKQRIKSGSTSTGGKVHYYREGSTGDWAEDTGSTYIAYDLAEGGPGAAAGDEVIVYRHQQSGKLHIVPTPAITRGTLDGDLERGGSATMSVWAGDPLTDSGRNVTVYDSTSLPEISSGKKIAGGVGLATSRHSGKHYLLVPYACEVDSTST